MKLKDDGWTLVLHFLHPLQKEIYAYTRKTLVLRQIHYH